MRNIILSVLSVLFAIGCLVTFVVFCCLPDTSLRLYIMWGLSSILSILVAVLYVADCINKNRKEH